MSARLCNGIRRGAVLLGVSAVALAPFASHAAMTTGRFEAAALLLAALQAATLVAVALRQDRPWQRGAGLVAAAGLLALLVLKATGPAAAGRAGLIASSGLSHAAIYASLLVLFGQSLRPGRTAVVTKLALRFHGVLPSAKRIYTRTVTKAWCIFFLAQLAASALLLCLAPDRVWSLFVNVLDGPLVAAMFLAEFAVRRWLFRHERHHSPLAVARAFARDRAGG